MNVLDRENESPDEEPQQLFDWLLPRGTHEQVVDETTAEFRIDTNREHRRIRTLMYETDILEEVLSTVSADDIFYDIGANVGVYTCFVGQQTDHVVAFEPHTETAARLRDNISLNTVDADVYECAVADYSGTASLSIPQRSSQELGTGEFSLVHMDDADDVGEIDVVVGDTLVAQQDLPRPTVAKIDVEGAELQVLSGLSETLRSCREVFIEIHLDHVTVEEIASWFTDAGFTLETLKERGNTTFLRATTESE